MPVATEFACVSATDSGRTFLETAWMTLTASPPELEERIGTSKLTQLAWL